MPEQVFRILKAEDYQYLLIKSLPSLEIHNTFTVVKQPGPGTNPKNKPLESKELFPRYFPTEIIFSFSEFFERQLKAE